LKSNYLIRNTPERELVYSPITATNFNIIVSDSVTGTAKQHDKAIELSLAAISEHPSPVAWYDLANRYARYKRDAVKAREALIEGEKSPVAAHVKPYRARCRGIIAYLEGDYPVARTELETALRSLEQPKWKPFRDGHLAIARAYLCCVLAKQGDIQEAEKNLNLAMKYLVATKEDELLAECRESIGNT
jgi:tetratricopeptide (TPR) repeat protein